MATAAEKYRKALNILILTALSVSAVGSVLFVIFRPYLAPFTDSGF